MKTIVIIVLISFHIIISKIKIKGSINTRYTSLSNERFLLSMCCILALISALRGDFTPDYRLYYSSIYRNYNSLTFAEALGYIKDIGFSIMFYIGNRWIDNYQVVIAIASAVTVLMYYLVVQNFSDNYFLSLLLFVSLGEYFISFNIIRNIMAASICLFCTKFVIEEKPINYFIGILFASLFHKSALVVLPMYYLLRIDFRKKKNLFAFIIAVATLFICIVNLDVVAFFVSKFFGMSYHETYSISQMHSTTGFGERTLFRMINDNIMFIFVIIFSKYINFDIDEERIWFNGCVMAYIFQTLTIQNAAMIRIYYYFSGFYIILIPLIISKIKRKREMTFLITIIILIRYIVMDTSANEYWFFWQNKYIKII